MIDVSRDSPFRDTASAIASPQAVSYQMNQRPNSSEDAIMLPTRTSALLTSSLGTAPESREKFNPTMRRFYWNDRGKGSSSKSDRMSSTPKRSCLKTCSTFDFSIPIEVALQVAVYMTILGFLFHQMHPYYEESFGDEYKIIGQRIGEVLNRTDCLSSISSSKLDLILSELSDSATRDHKDRSDENSQIYVVVSVVILVTAIICGVFIFAYYAWTKPLLSVIYERGTTVAAGPGDLSPALLRIICIIVAMMTTIVIVYLNAIANFDYGSTDEVAQQLLHGMFPIEFLKHDFKSVGKFGTDTIMLIVTALLLSIEIFWIVLLSKKSKQQFNLRIGRQKKADAKQNFEEGQTREKQIRDIQEYGNRLRTAAQLDLQRQRQYAALLIDKQSAIKNMEKILRGKDDEINQHKIELERKNEVLQIHESMRQIEMTKDKQILKVSRKAVRSGRHEDAANALTAALETGYTNIEEILNGHGVYSPKSPISREGDRRDGSLSKSRTSFVSNSTEGELSSLQLSSPAANEDSKDMVNANTGTKILVEGDKAFKGDPTGQYEF